MKFGDRIADIVVSEMGSWRFIMIQTVIILIWIGVNLWIVLRAFDPYPFILLNLLFSTQAAYASPLILMSQNREATRDRKRDDHEAQKVDVVYANHKELMKISQELLDINQQQLEILRLLQSQTMHK